MATSAEKLRLARRHLARVQAAWDPPDWADLSMYGLYCLEAAVDAAAIHLGIPIQAAHWKRVEVARLLNTKHELGDIAELLRQLNELRKREAYGDVEAPELDPEEVATQVETYVEAVARTVEGK